MNIVYKYMRRSAERRASGGKGRRKTVSFYDYFRTLAFFNKGLIAKHANTIEVEEAYAMSCVRCLPLSEPKDFDLSSCPLEPNKAYIRKRDQEALRNQNRKPNKPAAYYNSLNSRQDPEKCLHCWIKVLEDTSKTLEATPERNKTPLPSFLAKKELPSFLRKK